ncbi:MAG: type II toxin-antitoxin system HicB family antitoxin [Leptolyngbyaceae cyanobacterium SL_5_14]|nr:type II toxin-antitoxin system HicB family antitoxin [Leptolyngbyaceae cyanobacterium SL_5_14]
MTTDVIHASSTRTAQFPYPVLVEQQAEKGWVAQVMGWTECRAEGSSRETAIAALQQILSDRLAAAEVIYVDLPIQADLPTQVTPPIQETEHPWMKHAGMYENDPLFEQVLDEIEAYRRELDASR